MSAQLRAALVRAVVIGVLTFGATFFTAVQSQPASKAAAVAAASFFSIVLARGFGEGGYDANRQKNGDVKEGDVKPS
jgi:hypothetical protein